MNHFSIFANLMYLLSLSFKITKKLIYFHNLETGFILECLAIIPFTSEDIVNLKMKINISSIYEFTRGGP